MLDTAADLAPVRSAVVRCRRQGAAAVDVDARPDRAAGLLVRLG